MGKTIHGNCACIQPVFSAYRTLNLQEYQLPSALFERAKAGWKVNKVYLYDTSYWTYFLIPNLNLELLGTICSSSHMLLIMTMTIEWRTEYVIMIYFYGFEFFKTIGQERECSAYCSKPTIQVYKDQHNTKQVQAWLFLTWILNNGIDLSCNKYPYVLWSWNYVWLWILRCMYIRVSLSPLFIHISRNNKKSKDAVMLRLLVVGRKENTYLFYTQCEINLLCWFVAWVW
jgi:hypothetical protein